MFKAILEFHQSLRLNMLKSFNSYKLLQVESINRLLEHLLYHSVLFIQLETNFPKYLKVFKQ